MEPLEEGEEGESEAAKSTSETASETASETVSETVSGSAFPLFLDRQVEDRLSDKDFWSLDSDCHTLVPLSLSCNEIYGDRHFRGQ